MSFEESEESWFKPSNPSDWHNFLSGCISPRKIRLFAVACCRRVWGHLPTDACRRAVVVAERFADGDATIEELDAAREAVPAQVNGELSFQPDNPAQEASQRDKGHPWHDVWCDGSAANLAADRTVGRLSRDRPEDDPQWWEACEREGDAQMDLLRDVVGNPFRPVALNPAWRTETAVALARQMYESRDFSAMPVLADALHDVGCEDEQLLGHCRGPGPHVRGCWVVDLLLGRE